MGAILFLLAIVAPFVVAALATRTPRTLQLVWEEDAFEAPGAVSATSYRGHAPGQIVTTMASGQRDIGELPDAVRIAAGLCRIAFCGAMVSAVPVLFVMTFDPAVGVGLGVTGLVLAAGQLAARAGLLSGSAGGASRAAGVGIWTLVHQAAVVGVVIYATKFDGIGPRVSEGMRVFSLDSTGIVALAYAAASAGLGLALLAASRSLAGWRAQRRAI